MDEKLKTIQSTVITEILEFDGEWYNRQFDSDTGICSNTVKALIGSTPDRIKVKMSTEEQEGWIAIEVRRGSEMGNDGRGAFCYFCDYFPRSCALDPVDDFLEKNGLIGPHGGKFYVDISKY